MFPLASVGSSVCTLLAVRVATCPGPVSSQVAFCCIRCRCLTVSPWHLAFSPTSSCPAVTQRGGLPLVTGAHSACAQDRSGASSPCQMDVNALLAHPGGGVPLSCACKVGSSDPPGGLSSRTRGDHSLDDAAATLLACLCLRVGFVGESEPK